MQMSRIHLLEPLTHCQKFALLDRKHMQKRLFRLSLQALQEVGQDQIEHGMDQ